MQRYLIGLGVILVVVFGYLYLSNDAEVVKESVERQSKPNALVSPQGGGDKWWQQKEGDKPAVAKPSSGDNPDEGENAATENPIQFQEDISPEQWNAQFKDEPAPEMADLDTPSIQEIMSEPEIEPQPTLAPPPYEVPEGYQQAIDDNNGYSDVQPIDMTIDTTDNMMVDDGTGVNMMMDDGVAGQDMMMDDTTQY